MNAQQPPGTGPGAGAAPFPGHGQQVPPGPGYPPNAGHGYAPNAGPGYPPALGQRQQGPSGQGHPAPPGYQQPGYAQQGYGRSPGQPPHHQSYPAAQQVTGNPWWLGFITLVGPAIIGNIVGVGAMAYLYAQHRTAPSEVRRNVRNSLNWQISFAAYTLILIIAHVVLLFTLSDDPRFSSSFLPIGTAAVVYLIVGVYHLVMTVVCALRGNRGKVCLIPGTIPWLREA